MESRFDYIIKEEINIRDYLLSFHLSKSKVYKLFLDKMVLVNDNYVKENYLLKENDKLTIILDEEIDFKPQEGKLDILYEDSYYLIINKPRGLIIYEDSKDKINTLSNLVANYYKEKGLHLNVRFCHRLDKETTGVIVLCKDILCHSYMNYYIASHDIRREYHLLAQGSFNKKVGRINLPIGKDRHTNNKMVISKTGQEAITNYEVIKEFRGYTYLKAILETGRTHQIRLHFSYSGHPLLGDTLYGGNTHYMKNLALHSYKISFYHPVYKRIVNVSCKPPVEFLSLIGS